MVAASGEQVASASLDTIGGVCSSKWESSASATKYVNIVDHAIVGDCPDSKGVCDETTISGLSLMGARVHTSRYHRQWGSGSMK